MSATALWSFWTARIIEDGKAKRPNSRGHSVFVHAVPFEKAEVRSREAALQPV